MLGITRGNSFTRQNNTTNANNAKSQPNFKAFAIKPDQFERVMTEAGSEVAQHDLFPHWVTRILMHSYEGDRTGISYVDIVCQGRCATKKLDGDELLIAPYDEAERASKPDHPETDEEKTVNGLLKDIFTKVGAAFRENVPWS